MGVYDSKRFSAEFSKRTLSNYLFIEKYVDGNIEIRNAVRELSYTHQAIDECINDYTKGLRKSARRIQSTAKNEKRRPTAFSIMLTN